MPPAKPELPQLGDGLGGLSLFGQTLVQFMIWPTAEHAHRLGCKRTPPTLRRIATVLDPSTRSGESLRAVAKEVCFGCSVTKMVEDAAAAAHHMRNTCALQPSGTSLPAWASRPFGKHHRDGPDVVLRPAASVSDDK
ncbi:MAG TPA: hypothetical protein VFZ16_22695 [Hyphomicrobiaceae bacterium]|nr:hypothetical protein [Hyphomicrobiaceae bacterium]